MHLKLIQKEQFKKQQYKNKKKIDDKTTKTASWSVLESISSKAEDLVDDMHAATNQKSLEITKEWNRKNATKLLTNLY